jgi:purine-binding chemotaxis protein CheW
MKTDVVKLVTFQLGLDIFAADVLSVDRVLRYAPPNAVPDVPAWVLGVIEHREKVIPVVDLRRRVELSDDSITPETRILVLNTSGGWVGAIVDTVHEVASVPADSISAPPPLFRGLAAEFIRGMAKVGDQLVVILDVDRVMSSADRIAFDQTVATSRG